MAWRVARAKFCGQVTGVPTQTTIRLTLRHDRLPRMLELASWRYVSSRLRRRDGRDSEMGNVSLPRGVLAALIGALRTLWTCTHDMVRWHRQAAQQCDCKLVSVHQSSSVYGPCMRGSFSGTTLALFLGSINCKVRGRKDRPVKKASNQALSVTGEDHINLTCDSGALAIHWIVNSRLLHWKEVNHSHLTGTATQLERRPGPNSFSFFSMTAYS
jgi:hypothetical protein